MAFHWNHLDISHRCSWGGLSLSCFRFRHPIITVFSLPHSPTVLSFYISFLDISRPLSTSLPSRDTLVLPHHYQNCLCVVCVSLLRPVKITLGFANLQTLLSLFGNAERINFLRDFPNTFSFLFTCFSLFSFPLSFFSPSRLHFHIAEKGREDRPIKNYLSCQKLVKKVTRIFHFQSAHKESENGNFCFLSLSANCKTDLDFNI